MSTQTSGEILVFTRGDRLRKARERTGLEQGPFADSIGVSRGMVSNYERDQTDRVKPIVMKQWALTTGVDQHWLETGEGTPQGGGNQPNPTTQAEALEKLAAEKRSRTRGRGVTMGMSRAA